MALVAVHTLRSVQLTRPWQAGSVLPPGRRTSRDFVTHKVVTALAHLADRCQVESAQVTKDPGIRTCGLVTDAIPLFLVEARSERNILAVDPQTERNAVTNGAGSGGLESADWKRCSIHRTNRWVS